ncbi:SPOR domain-containing protein [Amphritea japonica]|uniref:SPOR domain-containing protein n=1 Tax=Amphritea japonica ATCC BAA-1530 TaxID=1278309 RepID=A0A7R6P980_9GAMM|nr:SPOR domain-containing protein [Amphritea japonica]BBB24891.1 conserved hypothetical protein [Amphritea japonica ATCC BAA-1530]
MARKDYAKKRNSGSAASRAPRRKSAPVKKPFPLVRIIISLLFLIGFGYALWQLTSVKPDNTATQSPAVQPSTAKKPAAKPATKPAAKASDKTASKATDQSGPRVEEQSERFDFYQILPQSEVDTANVEPYKSTPKDAKSEHTYVLQVGSFQNSKDAEQLRARLILEGLPNVHSRRVTNSNGSIWYQVRTGPFDNRSQLNKAQDRLVRLNIQPLLRQID